MSLTITDKIFKNLENINNYNIKYYEFDIVISGGGCAGYYYAGTFEIIKFLEKENKIKINKIYATSAGVLSSIFYLCDIDPIKLMETYNYAKKNNKNNKMNFHDILMDTIVKYIPKNAHILCNDILNIVVSKRTIFGFKKVLFNKFETLNELLLIISAAVNVPFLLSNKYMGININNNYYYDGLFTSNTPILYNSEYPQLVMKTHKIEYPLKYAFSVNDECIELLMIRGFIETEKFLNEDNKSLPFSWIDKNLKNKNKNNKSFYLVNLIFFGYCIFFSK